MEPVFLRALEIEDLEGTHKRRCPRFGCSRGN